MIAPDAGALPGPGGTPVRARRAPRALETVKKVVTALTTGVVDAVILVVLAGQATSGRVLMVVGPRQRMFTSSS